MNLSQLQNALNLIHDYEKKNKPRSIIISVRAQSVQKKRGRVRIRKAIPPCLRREAFGMPSRSDSSRRLLCIIM